MSNDLPYPDRRIAEIGARHGLLVLTHAERMQRRAQEQRAYFHGFANTVMGQGPWNELGHRVAAELASEDLCTPMLGGAVARR